MLAPIGISTYIRLQHLQQTISALQKNILARDSEIFIFSDAPKSGDEQQVKELRKYLYSVDGFKKVHIIERIKNSRTQNSRGGLKMLLDRFGKVIFLEEDIVTAPGFLTFMNQALDKYEKNEQVFSVSGYCPPMAIPYNYSHDVFFVRRYGGWGLGVWSDRYDHIKYISPDEFEQFAANKKKVFKFMEGTGDFGMMLLKADVYGDVDAGDIKAMYAQFLSDQYTVYPTRSLASNIGMDGTGLHCGNMKKYDVLLSEKTSFYLPDQVILNQAIIKSHRKFYNEIYGRFEPGLIPRAFRKIGVMLSRAWKTLSKKTKDTRTILL